jgi:hypothetical protein
VPLITCSVLKAVIAVKSGAMYNKHIAPFLLLLACCLPTTLKLAAANEPYSFTIIDFWQSKCDAGESGACKKLENNKLNQQKLEKLNFLAEEFQSAIIPAEFLQNNKPDLGKAYPLVIKNYLSAFNEHMASKPEEFTLQYCAKQFHEYWLNKKYWWPTNIKDEPDWATIYIYIVDHYHGICLRRSF